MPGPAQDEVLSRRVRKLEHELHELHQQLKGVLAEREPRLGIKRDRYKAVTNELIVAGGFGEVTVWKGNASSALAATTWIETAYLNWAHGGIDIPEGTEIWIEYHPDEKRWVITGKEC